MASNTRSTRTASRQPGTYAVVRIEKTRMPAGGGGQTWYQYELNNGQSTITGRRCGSLDDVTAYAHRYAKQLNTRAANNGSPWSPRARKQA